jgi:GNAT superfamily N-acetyltransferase
MPYSLVRLTQQYLEPAVALFIENYKLEQEHSPLLPPRAIDEPTWIHGVLESNLASPSVAIIEQNRLLGYMVTGDQFPWKGQQAAIIFEYCHGAIANKKAELYQRMYMYLAQEWANQQIHLHLIRHFAHDTILQETLYHLGFGAILAERLRDCSAVDAPPDLAIGAEQDLSKLITIHTEHSRYYPKAPIFISKPTQKQEVVAELEAHAHDGDVLFTYYQQHEPCAYMIIGASTLDGEGFLLQHTNTAQVKSAYARPGIRGTGIGTALLQRAIQWSKDQGYERILVEHETANFYGGNFWRKHFTPYVYASMRYIDPTLPIQE